MKSKTLTTDNLASLYDSRFEKFPSRFKLHWMGLYRIKIAHDNSHFDLVDFEGISLPTHINGYHLKKYHTELRKIMQLMCGKAFLYCLHINFCKLI